MEFAQLGLIVTDEQHRFGVRQRLALSQKGGAPHTIVMSATPIPRTLAFVLYGDLDISVLDEMPKNRLEVKTYLVGQDMEERVFAFVRKCAHRGLQSYIVCPLVENEEDGLSLEAATDLAKRIAGGSFEYVKITEYGTEAAPLIRYRIITNLPEKTCADLAENWFMGKATVERLDAAQLAGIAESVRTLPAAGRDKFRRTWSTSHYLSRPASALCS